MKANYNTETQKANGELKLSLYDLNKSAISSLPDYDELDIARSVELINDFAKGTYYMLLGRDINYYTIFIRTEGMVETIGEAVIDCLMHIGGTVIKSIEKTDDETGIEIWLDTPGGEPTILYFFDYEIGVIRCQ